MSFIENWHDQFCICVLSLYFAVSLVLSRCCVRASAHHFSFWTDLHLRIQPSNSFSFLQDPATLTFYIVLIHFLRFSYIQLWSNLLLRISSSAAARSKKLYGGKFQGSATQRVHREALDNSQHWRRRGARDHPCRPTYWAWKKTPGETIFFWKWNSDLVCMIPIQQLIMRKMHNTSGYICMFFTSCRESSSAD